MRGKHAVLQFLFWVDVGWEERALMKLAQECNVLLVSTRTVV